MLKVARRRWYVAGRNPYYSDRNEAKGIEPKDVYRVYALDRISDIQEAGKTFVFNKGFDAKRYFEGCCGIISNAKMERIVIRAFHYFADYLRTLPLHESQQELESDGKSTLFAYRIKPTFDFYQLALAQGDQMEVLEPESVRNEMSKLIANMQRLYR